MRYSANATHAYTKYAANVFLVPVCVFCERVCVHVFIRAGVEKMTVVFLLTAQSPATTPLRFIQDPQHHTKHPHKTHTRLETPYLSLQLENWILSTLSCREIEGWV